jgi:hypothetical protein
VPYGRIGDGWRRREFLHASSHREGDGQCHGSPDRPGPVEITIQLETIDELPLVAKAVSVTLSDARSGGGVKIIQAARGADDKWRVKTSLPSSGRWTLGLGISISDDDKVNIESPIVIR